MFDRLISHSSVLEMISSSARKLSSGIRMARASIHMAPDYQIRVGFAAVSVASAPSFMESSAIFVWPASLLTDTIGPLGVTP